MGWFQQPWFDSEAFESPWWHALLDEESGGSYVTLGYGQTASLVAMLGLVPGVDLSSPGNYVTLGTGQSASLFLRFGMGIGSGEPEPPIITPLPGGGYHFYYPPSERARILRDDQEIIHLLISALHSGLLD